MRSSFCERQIKEPNLTRDFSVTVSLLNPKPIPNLEESECVKYSIWLGGNATDLQNRVIVNRKKLRIPESVTNHFGIERGTGEGQYLDFAVVNR